MHKFQGKLFSRRMHLNKVRVETIIRANIIYPAKATNQMGHEVLEGLRVSQSQQRQLSRKINNQINAHPVTGANKI